MDPPPAPSHGGTRPKPPGELRSPVLRLVGEDVAEACVTRIYATWPELLDRYGERGRQFTAEDNHWHLNFLDAAIALRDPGHFHRYADWLVRFLGPRGLGPDHVAGAFGFLADGLAAAEIPPEHDEARRALVQLLHETQARVLASATAEAGRAAAPERADRPGPNGT